MRAMLREEMVGTMRIGHETHDISAWRNANRHLAEPAAAFGSMAMVTISYLQVEGDYSLLTHKIRSNTDRNMMCMSNPAKISRRCLRGDRHLSDLSLARSHFIFQHSCSTNLEISDFTRTT